MLPKEPKPNVFNKIEAIQVLYAGLAGSFFLVVWLTTFDFIINFFRPDALPILTWFRRILLLIGLSLTASTGKSVMILGKMLFEMLQTYNRIRVEIKKEIDKKAE